MKKVYASMIALACGALITSSAKTLVPANSVDLSGKKQGISISINQTSFTNQVAKTLSNPSRVASRAEEWVEIGTGYFFDGILTGDEYQVSIEANPSQPGMYRIPDAWTPVAGEDAQPFYIDATDPNFVIIPEQETGVIYPNVNEEMWILGFTYYLTEYEGLLPEEVLEDEEYSEYNIFETDGLVYFPEESLLMMFPDSREYTQAYFANDEMYVTLPDGPGSQWSEAKEGEMLDGFFEILFTGFEKGVVPVSIQKNNWADGVYKVNDPWLKLLEDFGGHALEIDASDPDFVVIPLQPTGIRTSDGAVYLASMSYLYEDYDEMVAEGDGDLNITMNEAGLINFPTTTVQGNNGPFEASSILYYIPDYDQEHLYYIGGASEGWIQVPDFTTEGISAIAADNNGVTEYYNIQGMRIANPQPGQLYIVKKDSQVSKVVY